MGLFTGALALGKAFFGSSVGKMVGTAVLSKALAPKQVQVRPAELRYAEQTETNDANLEVMRQKAEEAGFNPLTVLRAGGINAYATRKTNIPSYAPALYSTKGPSYIETIAGAAAQSYFNRPTEEQKASQALKIAQQYADLDYTRAMTAGARSAGKSVSISGSDVAEKVKPFYDEADAVHPDAYYSMDQDGAYVENRVETTLYPTLAQDGTVQNMWFKDEILEQSARHVLTNLSAWDNRNDRNYQKLKRDSDAYWHNWASKHFLPPLAEPKKVSLNLKDKIPAGSLYDRAMIGMQMSGR